MVKREHLVREVRSALKRGRAVTLTGPRQCGKTTLARQLVSAESPNYLELENPSSISRLDEPMTALRSLKGLVVMGSGMQAHGCAEDDAVHGDRPERPQTRTDRRCVSGHEAVFPGSARRRRPAGSSGGRNERAVSEKDAQLIFLNS
jgi:ABC-type polar amino acid transport system ATPase subunit